MSSAPCESGAGAERRPPRASDITPFAPLNTKHARASGHAHAHIAGRSSTFSLSPMLLMIEGVDRELTEIGKDGEPEDATHFATDGPAPRRYDGDTPRTVRCVPVFVRSEKSNALVGDGFLQPAHWLGSSLSSEPRG